MLSAKKSGEWVTPVTEYTCSTPRILWGAGRAKSIREELVGLGGRRALVLSGRTVGASDWFRALVAPLVETGAAVYSEIEPHTPVESLSGAFELAKARSVDCIVMVGGGAVMDAGKLLAVMLAEGEDLNRFKVTWTADRQLAIPSLTKPKIPLVAVPSTLSAAEVVGGAAFVSGAHRYVVVDPSIQPRVVIYDPEVGLTTPLSLFLGTGINAIAHCVEATWSVKSQPFSDALAEGSLRELVAGLSCCAADPTDIAARQQAMVGAAMSGVAYTGAWLGIAHSLVQALGARLRVSQGQLHAIVLPHAMRFNLPVTADRQERLCCIIADAMPWAQSAQMDDASVMVAQFIRSLGLPAQLRELGVPKAELGVVAEDAFTVWHTYFNPRRVENPHELLKVLQAAW